MELNLFKIPSSSRVLLLSAIFSLADALPWSGPDPTALYKPANWNPRPTGVPQSPTELLKRGDANASICGWVDGNLNQPAACPSDEKCVYDTSHGMVGCCPTSGSCTSGVYIGCVNVDQPELNPSILTCSGGSVCYENTFPGGYYQYACGAATDAKSIKTTFSGQNWASQLQIIFAQLTLATTLSTSNTILSTTTVTQSSSLSSAISPPVSSRPFQTTTSTSTSLSSGVQPLASTTAITVATTGSGPQGQAGIIAGSVVGGVGVTFAILALCCGLMRRRQTKKAEERAKSIPTKDKTMSISSYASSQFSGHTRIHPFSPDDIVSPLTPSQQADGAPLHPMLSVEPQQEAQPLTEAKEPHLTTVQLVDTPRSQPQAGSEQPYIRRIQLFDAPSIDELADLPTPWIRSPTPPPRSAKRLIMQVHPPEDHTPLEVYLKSAIMPLCASSSVSSHTSDTSQYSRTTDGRSVMGDSRHSAWREEEIPPMPIIRKPVGSGWYRTMPPLTEKRPGGHVAFQITGDLDTGRSLTAPQQARERRFSAPAPLPVTSDVLRDYSEMGANISNVQELNITGMESDWVEPLILSPSRSVAVDKRANTPVPILGVPAAPLPGGRGSRLYEVQ